MRICFEMYLPPVQHRRPVAVAFRDAAAIASGKHAKWRLLAVVIVAGFASVGEVRAGAQITDAESGPDTCMVSQPMSPDDPKAPKNGNFGNESVSTILGSRLTFRPGGPGAVHADGALSMKYMWWRTATGDLRVEGERLDGDAPPLRAHIPPGYGDTGFQSTSLIFPTPGCWRVTAYVGDAELSFVVSVNIIGDGPCSRQSANLRELVQQVRGKVRTISIHREEAADSDEGGPFVRVRGKRRYSGGSSGISGAADFDFLQVDGPEGYPMYVGYERISGYVAGKRGTFIVRHEGRIVEGISRSAWQVVASSGTGELAEVQGKGTYSSGLEDLACYSFERTAP